VGGVCDVACFSPLNAWQSLSDRSVHFSQQKAGDAKALSLPCGRCVGCRLERSRQWAIRCVHESKLHERSSFLTLTYSPENLPTGGSLDYSHFQKFLKRVRKSCGPVRFYMCGEYGDSLDRPHFHCLLFGEDFSVDRKPWKRTGAGVLYRSQLLERLWPYGHSLIGEVNFDTAAYVARYVMKKITGDLAEDHYKRVDSETGEIFMLTPEFTRMSLKPGIGAGFFHKFASDMYPADFVISRAKKVKPPRYYDVLLERMSPDLAADVKEKREFDAAAVKFLDGVLEVDEVIIHERSDERLKVRQQCAEALLSTKKRDSI